MHLKDKAQQEQLENHCIYNKMFWDTQFKTSVTESQQNTIHKLSEALKKYPIACMKRK